MTKKVDKTNAARLLDKAGIAYKLIPYEFDENDLAAQHVDALDDVRLQATLDLCNLIIVLVADTTVSNLAGSTESLECLLANTQVLIHDLALSVISILIFSTKILSSIVHRFWADRITYRNNY